MKLTDALLGEHGVLWALMDEMDRRLAQAGTLGEVHAAASMLSAALVSHARVEDELLFPALEARLGPAGPLAVMRHEHTEIDRAVDHALHTDSLRDARETLQHALEVTRGHFLKEERVLFGLARQAIPPSELEELGARWADLRRVTTDGRGCGG